MDKYDIANVLLNEAMTPEQEHEARQKQREKDWAQRGKAAGALTGFAAGAGGVLKGAFQKKQFPGVTRMLAAGAVGAGSAFAAGMIGKKIAVLVARMTKQGYTKPEIAQAVNNLKRQARQ
jgi:hypothetical protein